MIYVKDENQVTLFDTPFENELDKNNRWIKFSKIILWDKVSSYYNQRMCKKNGAVTTDARIVLGALIIKHHENLSDVGTIEAIQENIYMQYFLGLPSFKTESVFAPSLFIEIRKRLGTDYWNEINEIIIKHNTPKKNDNDEPTSTQESNDETIAPAANKGTINTVTEPVEVLMPLL